MHRRICMLFIPLVAALVLAPLKGDAEEAKPVTRFAAFDVFVDSKTEALVAYQVEVTFDKARVKIVGVEGGAPAGWQSAPYYDRKGMESGVLVLGAFTPDDAQSTTGRVRVARLHLEIQGAGTPALAIRVVTAAKPGGTRIPAQAQLQEPAAEAETEKKESPATTRV